MRQCVIHIRHTLATTLAVVAGVWIVVCSLSSCAPGVPDEYIQPGKMEDILYDYHLAQGIIDTDGQRKMGDSIYIKAYKLAVMKKHGVSEADFDKSLQYYMRHTTRLHDIYEHLAQRYENEALKQGASVNDLNNFGSLTAKGDTADIWTGERAAVLIPKAPYNMLSFAFKADTTFHAGDRFTLSFNSQFIIQEGSRDAVVVLALELDNDSVVTLNRHISSNMPQNLQIGDTERHGIRSLRGFIIFNRGFSNTDTTLKLFSITGLRLIRMHTKETPPEPEKPAGDSLKSARVTQTSAPPPPNSGAPTPVPAPRQGMTEPSQRVEQRPSTPQPRHQ